MKALIFGVLLVGLSSGARAENNVQLMPAMVLRQMCDEKQPGCRLYIGAVAETLFYAARGAICFPTKQIAGLIGLDLDDIVEKGRYGLSKVAPDENSPAVLFAVWKASYPCN